MISIAIRRNIVFPDKFDQLQPPRAELEVTTGDGGVVTDARVVKPSSMPSWDAAVLRAVWKTERIPSDADGRVPKKLTIVFTPQ